VAYEKVDLEMRRISGKLKTEMSDDCLLSELKVFCAEWTETIVCTLN